MTLVHTCAPGLPEASLSLKYELQVNIAGKTKGQEYHLRTLARADPKFAVFLGPEHGTCIESSVHPQHDPLVHDVDCSALPKGLN